MDSLFGFCGCLGFCGVRFLPHVRVAGCSVCSVDFVEKMWRSLWGKRWENCGICCGIKRNRSVLHSFGGFCEIFRSLGGKFYGWIYTWFYLCNGGGFAQFPHSLLLQLLNI